MAAALKHLESCIEGNVHWVTDAGGAARHVESILRRCAKAVEEAIKKLPALGE